MVGRCILMEYTSLFVAWIFCNTYKLIQFYKIGNCRCIQFFFSFIFYENKKNFLKWLYAFQPTINQLVHFIYFNKSEY